MTTVYNKKSEKEKRRNLRHQMPPAETILWSRLRANQISGVKIRRQHSIDLYVLDFYCPQAKLAVELDGESHDSSKADKHDAERQSYIESFGITFLRFTNQDVYNHLEDVVEAIATTAMERISQRRPPPNPSLVRRGDMSQ